MVSNRFNGAHGWAVGDQAPSKEAEELLARCDTDYQEIFTRLTQAVGKMIERGDGDALVLLSSRQKIKFTIVVNRTALFSAPIMINM